MPQPTAPTETGTRPVPSTEDGDHERFAHYIRSSDWERAYIHGRPVVALCGKRWVPSKDPSRYPVCPTCREIRARLTAG
jgi:hypothetical protein